MICVYILRSLKDKKNYIGSTNNLERRLREHSRGYVKSTVRRRPLVLKGYQECRDIFEAVKFEKQYKRSHGVLERAMRKGLFVVIDSVGAAQRALPGGGSSSVG
ncbi:hypothetical protein A3A48_04135 [Candidatus Curtissbacteria bacterium RIFCSPLOWO2_01_FULL_37_9]|uniref:GIY-YIG domain-containing protein n=1 Tax=Candidatus Curtissbacteria bacterium RIFCSPLOWO2_01_FULL_37_9 TaxID=1797724 RepID=A0A1F5GTR3_9BACT|nr:MAG: hypothetical protein A3A48_04135 [Candidatus Curtissbacteria bacterium RIFCSPLOWO2_01_FULL_37_9]